MMSLALAVGQHTETSLSPLSVCPALLKHPSSQSSIRAAKVQADKASCKAAEYRLTLFSLSIPRNHKQVQKRAKERGRVVVQLLNYLL